MWEGMRGRNCTKAIVLIVGCPWVGVYGIALQDWIILLQYTGRLEDDGLLSRQPPKPGVSHSITNHNHNHHIWRSNIHTIILRSLSHYQSGMSMAGYAYVKVDIRICYNFPQATILVEQSVHYPQSIPFSHLAQTRPINVCCSAPPIKGYSNTQPIT